MKLSLSVIAGAMLIATQTQALSIISGDPSFSCNGRLTPTEQTICNTPFLGQMDQAMVGDYEYVLSRLNQMAPGQIDVLRAEQREWLKDRNRCGRRVRCLEDAYATRLDQLKAWIFDVENGFEHGEELPQYPMAGYSWGGKVRSGPSMHHSQVGSTFEGQNITLVRRTDEFKNGYFWFEITFNNRRGYQWGGILCNLDVPDEAYTCPR